MPRPGTNMWMSAPPSTMRLSYDIVWSTEKVLLDSETAFSKQWIISDFFEEYITSSLSAIDGGKAWTSWEKNKSRSPSRVFVAMYIWLKSELECFSISTPLDLRFTAFLHLKKEKKFFLIGSSKAVFLSRRTFFSLYLNVLPKSLQAFGLPKEYRGTILSKMLDLV